MVRPDKYIRIWVLQISPRQIATIDRMVFFSDEKEFVDQKKIRQKTGSGKEIMARDLEAKKKMEKFYINAEVDIPRIGWRRQDGFSIYRSQLPQLISALQGIIDGEYDADMSSKISKLINPEVIQERPEEIQDQRPTLPADGATDWDGITPLSNPRPKYTEEIYDEWFRRQSEETQEDLLEFEKFAKKEIIYDAFYVNDE